VGFAAVDPEVSVVPVSLQVSMVAEGFHGNRGLVLRARASDFVLLPALPVANALVAGIDVGRVAVEVVHARCAGMDISKTDAKVCVRIAGAGRRKTAGTATTWGAMTGQILTLRDHLAAEKVTCVVMEATGLLEAVLLPARGPSRGTGHAGQCPAREEPAGP